MLTDERHDSASGRLTPPVFIVGMPRSGTTLFSMMLNRHPEVAICPETHYYERFRRRSISRWSRESTASWIDKVLTADIFRPFHFSENERRTVVEDALSRDTPDHASVMRAIMHCWARRTGRSVVGEKTPGHVFHLSQILADFPNAVIFHVLRDPRDVIVSLREVSWRPRGLLDHLDDWERAVRQAGSVPPNRCLEIRYEDLVEHPASVMADALYFLGLDSADVSHTKASQPNFDLEFEPWKAGASGRPRTSRRERWRDCMLAEEQWLTDRRVGPLMVAKGYRLSGALPDSGPVLVLVKFQLQRFWFGARNLTRRSIFWLRRRLSGAGTP